MTKSPAIARVISLPRTVLLTILFALSLLTLMPGQAQTFEVLHNFSAGGDGATPYAGLSMDRAGNLYGTTFGGGSRSLGAVYRLRHSGQSWIAEGLYSFTGGPHDGLHPLARVVFGPDGSLYGTTNEGGPGQFCGGVGCGMVFQLRPPLTFCRSVSCPWTESVLYFFAGVPDGGLPSGELVFDQAGSLYGTTDIGGNFGGILYELTRSGSAWTESIIHEFSGSDGYFPFGGLIFDNAGNLFGAAQEGGLFARGSIFQFTHSESGWTQSLPYIFHGENDGRSPNASLVFDQTGDLYGTSSDGGSGGGGTVFELSPAGGGWVYSLLYSFTGRRTLGCPNPGNQSGGPGPWAPLVMDGAGNLYGTTLCDGAHQFGNVFKLTPTGAGWSYTSLHDFTGGEDGAYPLSSVAMDASNNLYGTASGGGPQGHGVVWEITP